MAERERTRERERDPLQESTYERCIRGRREHAERQTMGQILIRESDRPLETSRQGHLRFYLEPLTYKDVPLLEWRVFTHEVRTRSGKHRHQGGLVIYVIEGEGYSIVEGERIDWEAGDVLLLPMQPGGVEHQHFNENPQKPALWIAFIHNPTQEYLAHELTQVEATPDFKA